MARSIHLEVGLKWDISSRQGKNRHHREFWIGGVILCSSYDHEFLSFGESQENFVVRHSMLHSQEKNEPNVHKPRKNIPIGQTLPRKNIPIGQTLSGQFFGIWKSTVDLVK